MYYMRQSKPITKEMKERVEIGIGTIIVLSIINRKQSKMKCKLRGLLNRYGKRNIEIAIETVGNNIYCIESFLVSQGHCGGA
ncbi:hypothetical protein ACFLY1_00495 [Patescibacteria group bacterium]